jgi:hypothetical protein
MAVIACVVLPLTVCDKALGLLLRMPGVVLLCRGSASGLAGTWPTEWQSTRSPLVHRLPRTRLLLPLLCFQMLVWVLWRLGLLVTLPLIHIPWKMEYFCVRIGWARFANSKLHKAVPWSTFPRAFHFFKYFLSEHFEYHLVGSLHFPIMSWVCHRRILDLDASLFTKVEEFCAGEIWPQICDDTVGYSNLNMFSWMNSTALAKVRVAIGLYSIHFVNLSIVRAPRGGWVGDPVKFNN